MFCHPLQAILKVALKPPVRPRWCGTERVGLNHWELQKKLHMQTKERSLQAFMWFDSEQEWSYRILQFWTPNTQHLYLHSVLYAHGTTCLKLYCIGFVLFFLNCWFYVAFYYTLYWKMLIVAVYSKISILEHSISIWFQSFLPISFLPIPHHVSSYRREVLQVVLLV